MQHSKPIRFSLLFLLAIFIFGGVVMWVQAARAAETVVHEIPLQVQLPGTAKCTQPGYTDRYCVRDIGEYILNFYRWFVSITGVLAVAMVVLGGFQWITAAGNASKITSAKEIMNGAFSGIILVMLSFLMLQLINPQILSLRLPVEGITNIPFALGQPFCGGRAIVETGLICGQQATLKNAPESGIKDAHCIYEGNCKDVGKTCSPLDAEGKTWGCLSPTEACERIPPSECERTDAQFVQNGTKGADGKALSCRQRDLTTEIPIFGLPNDCFADKVWSEKPLFTPETLSNVMDAGAYQCHDSVSSSKTVRFSCDVGAGKETPCWDARKGPKAFEYDPSTNNWLKSIGSWIGISKGRAWCTDDPRANVQSDGICCGKIQKDEINCRETGKSDEIMIPCEYYNTAPMQQDKAYQKENLLAPEVKQCTSPNKCWMEIQIE